MKVIRLLIGTAFALAGLVASTAQASNSLTFQGVTLETLSKPGNVLELTIINANHATGNWSGVQFLEAFEIKNVGNVTGATITPNDMTDYNKELNNKGCTGGGGADWGCFKASTPIALTDNMTWDITFSGINLNFGLPHLKVEFYKKSSDTRATGDLLSMDLPVYTPPPPRRLRSPSLKPTPC